MWLFIDPLVAKGSQKKLKWKENTIVSYIPNYKLKTTPKFKKSHGHALLYTNNIGQPNQSGATFITSVRSIVFYIHNIGKKKQQKKFRDPRFLKKLGIGSPDWRLFAVLFSY